MKKIIILVSLALLINGCGNSENTKENTSTVKYKLTFKSLWNVNNFPTAFPSGKEHFSGLIGATHIESKYIWQSGSQASQSIKVMAETGSKTALKNEIAKSSDFSLVEGRGISVGKDSVNLEFSTTKDKPLLSLTAMVAPSPDWFVGINSFKLYDENTKKWIQSQTISLKIYDAGTDSGSTFISDNINTNPRENISLLTEPEIDINNGVQSISSKAIGTFTIEKL